MKREERYDIEFMNHKQAIEDINFFYEVLDEYKIKEGEKFVEPHSGDVVICSDIEYETLQIWCCKKPNTIRTEFSHWDLIEHLKRFK